MENNQSIWRETIQNKKCFECLKDDLKVDVCVIGGGITGVSCAYYLSKSGKDVALIEKDEIGSKTSGGTTGKITSQHHLFYDYLIHSQSKEFAKKYLKANEEAISEMEMIIKNEKIECDFEKKKSYVWTNKLDNLQQIKDEIENVQSLGMNCKFTKELEVIGNVEGAIEFENQAQFNPIKYIFGLTNVCVNNGVQIFENTKAVSYEKNLNSFIINAESNGNVNKIFAKHVIVCTRYPIFNVPGFHFVKMYQELEYGIALKTKHKLNGMYVSLETPTISFRDYIQGNENYILIVGNGHKTGDNVSQNGFKVLEDFAKKYFPNQEIIYRWNAEDCIGLDKIAYIGNYSHVRENMYVATGFKKWGMTTSNIAARIITDKILGKYNQYAEIFDSTRIEPIKNKDEMKNMLKEMGESLIKPRIILEKGKKYCEHLRSRSFME